jgi:hypothetical protein
LQSVLRVSGIRHVSIATECAALLSFARI